MLKNISIITQNRIDIVIGIEYVDYYENQYNTDFFIDLYIEHKRSFNGLSEGIYKGKEAHINRFNCLIDSIKANKGNDVSIPVIKCNNEYWVVNGFHRSSIINYYNLNGNFTIEYRKNINIGYYPTDIYFFKNRNYDSKYCNYTIKCFLKYYNKEFSCIILFPNKKNLSNDLYNKIKKELIYELNIPLSNLSSNFTNNFIQLLYYNENWCKNGGSICKSKLFFIQRKNLKLLFIKKKKTKRIS